MRESSGTAPGGARGGHDECGTVQAWGGLCGAMVPWNDRGRLRAPRVPRFSTVAWSQPQPSNLRLCLFGAGEQ